MTPRCYSYVPERITTQVDPTNLIDDKIRANTIRNRLRKKLEARKQSKKRQEQLSQELEALRREYRMRPSSADLARVGLKFVGGELIDI